MIKFYNQVPSVYPSASRDFQYLCWLIDIVLNGVKHNVDDLYDLPDSKTDPRLTELLALTLGFKVKRNYDQDQLRALVAALPRILRYKGTIAAVKMAGNALVAASGATGSFRIEKEINNGELEVKFPEKLVDISLFVDLLPYVLPAGMTCHIIRTNQVSHDLTTEFDYQDIMLAEWIPDLHWDDNNKAVTGSAGMFNVGNSSYDFSTFANFGPNNEAGTKSLSERFNAGLLNNTIIPALVEPLKGTQAPENTTEDTGDDT